MRVLVSFFWWLLIKIMKSAVTFLNLDSTVPMQRSPRRRPLHTCGASLLVIAQKGCTKVQDIDGPLGSMAIRATSFMSSFFPFVYSFLYPLFALLSFMDDHILTWETKVETIFPLSTRLFDKIDGLVCRAETLPGSIDDILKNIPLIVRRFPFLDWILVLIISHLNSLLSIITQLGSRSTREKEITIDVNSNDIHMSKSEQSEEESGVGQSDFPPGKGDPNKARITENSNAVDLEELVKSYPSQERCKAATRRNHIEFEPSKAITCEIIQKSLDRLLISRNRIKILDEPHFGASPIYTFYQSANSSPVSDCSEGEISPFRRVGNSDCMSYSYKEMLERGQTEVLERKAAGIPETFSDEETRRSKF